MNLLGTTGLTKLIQLIKSNFISTADTVQTSEVTLATVATTGAYSDLSGRPSSVIVDTYINGTEWYRLWSDGWCEQGGVTSSLSETVTLLKEMADTNYTVNVTCKRGTAAQSAEGNSCGYSVSTTQIFVHSGVTNYGAYWTIAGYANQGD